MKTNIHAWMHGWIHRSVHDNTTQQTNGKNTHTSTQTRCRRQCQTDKQTNRQTGCMIQGKSYHYVISRHFLHRDGHIVCVLAFSSRRHLMRMTLTSMLGCIPSRSQLSSIPLTHRPPEERRQFLLVWRRAWLSELVAWPSSWCLIVIVFRENVVVNHWGITFVVWHVYLSCTWSARSGTLSWHQRTSVSTCWTDFHEF